jgi:hypothetical protein
MPDWTPFIDKARHEDIPDDEVERWIATAKPCAVLDIGGDGPVVGVLGGAPALPAGTPHPDFPFVASIDLAALPADATDLTLPRDGHLLFFADALDLCDGDSASAVVHVPAGAETAPVPRGDEEPAGRALRLVRSTSLPNVGTTSVEHPHGSELGGVWWNTGDAVEPASGELRLGGYPWVWNADPRDLAAEYYGHDADPAAWVLLAQWNTDDVDLDLGVVHWSIHRDDLAVGRFDRVVGTGDMVG